jgi:soluble lytic murein transglycosylase-like protein
VKPHCLLVKVAFLSLCTNVLPSQAAQPSAHIDQCLQQAAQFHKVAYPLLRAIAEQESGFNPLAVRKPYVAGNLDASTDYGLMQINSSWLPKLATWGITKQSLFDPCVNAHVGAWILSQNFRRLGVNWTAVGAYNAVSEAKRTKYAWAVYQRLNKSTSTVGLDHERIVPKSTGGRLGVWERPVEQVAME